MGVEIQYGADVDILVKPTKVIRFVGEQGEPGDDAEFDPGVLAGFMSKQEAYDRFALFEASIRLNSEQIELKVSRQEFNAFGVRLSNAETKITQTADAILLRATKEEFNALNQRVSSAEASITVSAAAINSKVSQTTYNAFTGQVNTRFSSIEQTAFGITQTVQGIPTLISGSINALQFGARNYFKKSTVLTNANGASITLRTETGFRVRGVVANTGSVRLNNVLSGNGWHTISFDARSFDVAWPNNNVDFNDGTSMPFDTTTVFKRFSFKFEVYSYSADIYHFIDINGLSGQEYEFKNIMVVRGNQAMDYSPAPEDMYGYTDALYQTLSTRITQTEAAISLIATSETVSALTGRISAAEASIVVQANQIQNKVNVSTYNSLQERVSTAESTITQQATLIQSKVSQSTVDSLTNRVSNSESIISQHSSQISQKVSSTDFTGQTLVSLINQTASNIKIQAKNIDLVGLTTANSLRTAAAGRRITINENNDNAIKIRYDNNTVGLEAVVTPLDEVKLVFRDKNGNIIWEAGKSGLVYINELAENWGARFHRLVTPVGSPDLFYDLDGNLMFSGESLRSNAQSTTNANGFAVRGEREQFSDGQVYEFRNYTLNTSQFVTNWEYNAGQNANTSLNQQYNGIHTEQNKAAPFIQNGWYITNGSSYGWSPAGGYSFAYDVVAVKDGKVIGAVTGQIENITLPNN